MVGFSGSYSRFARRAEYLVFSFGSGVGLVVYLGQVLEVKVSINLGRTNVSVTQQFLHTPQIVTGLQQVGGK